jgi:lipopolysaccharide biosynthesis regulator YciM
VLPHAAVESEMSIGKNILSVALAGALLLPLAAHAQLEGSGDPLSVSHHKKPKAAAAAAAEEAQYPKATRADPKMVASDFNDKLAKIDDEVKGKKNDDALAGAQEILNNPKASGADRAMAAYYAGFAAMDKNGNDYSQTIAFFQRAISENALPNNVHYAVMLNVAQMQLNEQKYADALVTAERFLSETQSDDVKAYAVEGNSQYRLGHYPEAVAALKKVLGTSTDAVDNNNVVQMLIASYQEMKQPNEAVALAEQLAAKNPDDKNAQMIVASIYAGANQPEKASAIFDRLRSKGMLTESKDYQTGYRLLDQIGGRAKDIIALINEGLDKKILTPSPEVYSLLGQSYYDSQQTPQAIAAWEKGAALSQDGDISLNIAKVHNQEQQWAAAKTAAHQALDKGLEHPGEAWLEIGVAEAGLGNKAARAAAYREAAKDPETRAQANKALK